MRWVTMRHEGVEGVARVSESAVPQMTHAGWTEVPDPEPAPAEAPSTPPGGEPGTATSRRRAGQETRQDQPEQEED